MNHFFLSHLDPPIELAAHHHVIRVSQWILLNRSLKIRSKSTLWTLEMSLSSLISFWYWSWMIFPWIILSLSWLFLFSTNRYQNQVVAEFIWSPKSQYQLKQALDWFCIPIDHPKKSEFKVNSKSQIKFKTIQFYLSLLTDCFLCFLLLSGEWRLCWN